MHEREAVIDRRWLPLNALRAFEGVANAAKAPTMGRMTIARATFTP